MKKENKKIVEFHIGRGGRFNNPDYLTFCGVGSSAKHHVENNNFLGYENEGKLIEESGEEIIDLIIDLRFGSTDGERYKSFCQRYGNLGARVVKSHSGNVIGDYVEDGSEFHYDEDGQYNTTYGVLVSGFNDLTEREQDAVMRNRHCFENEFDCNLSKDYGVWQIQDSESGNVIEDNLSYTNALERLLEYEAEDKSEGTYSEGFYEVVEM